MAEAQLRTIHPIPDWLADMYQSVFENHHKVDIDKDYAGCVVLPISDNLFDLSPENLMICC